MQEIWKDIPNYEGYYQVSNLGNIKSLSNKKRRSEKIISQINNFGYLSVGLYKGGKRKIFKVHRLVGICFLENPLKKDTINHIDGNKSNNICSNLEWATLSENIKHTYSHLNRKPRGK